MSQTRRVTLSRKNGHLVVESNMREDRFYGDDLKILLIIFDQLPEHGKPVTFEIRKVE